ncbi:type VI secretion system contractile sheath domain-containing protein [Pseudoduganella aquatica]|uniref:type VI secretion system contractile sheath domain-containing protein n=1 Tax=Pseudoduganella aquatica TaxID=2660641 RepID=UPI001E654631|nr:type VI secretion system contractile sheath large subunit [Pseudoduganella aquatica]
MATSLTFEFGFAAAGPQEAGEDGQPMRILVMGDFSGRAGRPMAAGIGAARRVDIDNFDHLLAQLAPSVQVTLDGAVNTFQFRELDDFHPDQLYQKSDAFAALRTQRQQLRNPATFAAASAALQSAAGSAAPPASAQAPQPAASDFASLLGGQVRQPAAPASGLPDIDQLIRRIAGAMPPGPDPRQPEYVAALDGVIAQRMRAVLHAPQFQALEANWRGLRQIVTGLELGQDLQLYIMDADKAALQADIDTADGALETSTLHKLLVEQPRMGADAAPWSVLCGAYSFGPGEADVGLLAALGALAARAQAPFLADASAALAGATSLADQPDAASWQELDAAGEARWQALRATPQASWLGLVLPRVLLRLPYGKATDRTDQFEFEEADADHEHEDYLWGHASLACALLLGRAFEDSAWDMSPGDALDLDDLPAHTVRRDGQAHMQACAEAFLSERAGTVLLERGLMPLLSFKNRNAARLLRSQSISHPARALSGAWNS